MTKIIVSYDGTENDDDALALARVFGDAGAALGLAYVRHVKEPEGDRETAAQEGCRGVASGMGRSGSSTQRSRST